MKTYITAVLVALATMLYAQDEITKDTPYPIDKATNRITFSSTLYSALDSLTTAKKLQDYLFTTYKDVKQVGNKTYCTGSYEVHKTSLNGGVAKGKMNLQGEVNYSLIVEQAGKDVIITRTNFQFVGATKANPINPMYGQKMKIADKPLEETKVNHQETFFKMEDEKATFIRLLDKQ